MAPVVFLLEALVENVQSGSSHRYRPSATRARRGSGRGGKPVAGAAHRLQASGTVTEFAAEGADHDLDGFDLICLLDTLHDLGDPAAALAHARKALAPDGAVLVVEPNAADDYAENLAGPLAALSYAASTFQCTPAALAQPGGVALGAQAGPAAVRQLAGDAGFSRFRQVTQTPVNVVLELRP